MANPSGTGSSTVAIPATGGRGAEGFHVEDQPSQQPQVEGLEATPVRCLDWRRVVEERLISLEARVEREAEERRERLEEQRVEQERLHELRLFTIFTTALSAAGTGIGHASLKPSSPLNPAKSPAQAPGMSQSERDTPTPPNSSYLSDRGNHVLRHVNISLEGFRLYEADKHDFTSNPDGIISLATSENKLCYDLLSKRLMQADMLYVTPALLEYADFKGHYFLREEVASFLTEYCNAPSPLKAENVIVMNGCTSLFCSIAVVICDPGDALLIPTPFYYAIREDVNFYGGVQLYHVHLDCEPSGCDEKPFHLTPQKLEEAMEQAKAEGVRVKGVIFVNPHNPSGDIYSAQEMMGFLEFAARHEIHAIVDELYMLSVFTDSPAFRSVLSFNRLPDAQRTHVLWGMSKDFGAAGLRMGTVYSENRDILSALDKLAPYHSVPGPTQHQVALLLRDRDWFCREYLPQNRARMAAAHRYISGELQSLGIPFLNRNAGLYIWADFRKVLSEQSFLAEIKLWRFFLHHKLQIRPGQAFGCAMPGWFRIIFTDQEERLQLAMQRLRKVLEELGWRSGRLDAEACGTGPGKENSKGGLVNSSDEAEPKRDPPSSPIAKPTSSSLLDKDFITLDRQTSLPASGSALDSLIRTLRQQIRSSDWLEKNYLSGTVCRGKSGTL